MGYLFTFLKPEHGYYKNWLEFRKRRRTYWWTFLAYPPLFLLIAIPTTFALHAFSLPDSLALIPVGIGIGAVMIYQIKTIRWTCPRCGKPFIMGRYGVIPWASACGHCGLPVYSPCDPADQQLEFASHMPQKSAATSS